MTRKGRLPTRIALLAAAPRAAYSAGLSEETPHRVSPTLYFSSPRGLPRAAQIEGRVVVLDIAFAASAGGGVSYESTTLPFISGLGARLAAWVDHHDHERHIDYINDPRFVLTTKAEHGACPELVTPELVRQTGPVDTIVMHLDLDGLYSAAKWILGGREPYSGADDDARCVDTRVGEATAIALRIDHALRARFRDLALKRAVVHWLVDGMKSGTHNDLIDEAAREYAVRARGTLDLVRHYVRRGRVAFVDVSGVCAGAIYDKTALLLEGQARAEVSMVRDSGMLTIAAAFDSGWNFVEILGLEGGMPTRVTVPESRLQEALDAINGCS